MVASLSARDSVPTGRPCLLATPSFRIAAMKPVPARLLALLALAASCAPALADDAPHDEVLAAVRRGEIRPLAEIEAKVRARQPGEIIKIEIERKHGVLVYEFKILDAEGRRREIHVDARNGDVLDRKRR